MENIHFYRSFKNFSRAVYRATVSEGGSIGNDKPMDTVHKNPLEPGDIKRQLDQKVDDIESSITDLGMTAERSAELARSGIEKLTKGLTDEQSLEAKRLALQQIVDNMGEYKNLEKCIAAQTDLDIARHNAQIPLRGHGMDIATLHAMGNAMDYLELKLNNFRALEIPSSYAFQAGNSLVEADSTFENLQTRYHDIYSYYGPDNEFQNTPMALKEGNSVSSKALLAASNVSFFEKSLSDAKRLMPTDTSLIQNITDILNQAKVLRAGYKDSIDHALVLNELEEKARTALKNLPVQSMPAFSKAVSSSAELKEYTDNLKSIPGLQGNPILAEDRERIFAYAEEAATTLNDGIEDFCSDHPAAIKKAMSGIEGRDPVITANIPNVISLLDGRRSVLNSMLESLQNGNADLANVHYANLLNKISNRIGEIDSSLAKARALEAASPSITRANPTPTPEPSSPT